MANRTLQDAKKKKNDEFYTQLADIESELKHYRQHFPGKTVFCNCDDPYESNFFKYFALNFNTLGLKKLITTSYDTSPVAYTQLDIFGGESEPIPNPVRRAYRVEITEVDDFNADGATDIADIEYLLRNRANTLTLLNGNGDFRAAECIERLREEDDAVPNPPFSLFRDYVAQLMEFGKQFLIIGNQNAITYKEIFPLLKDNMMWLGFHSGAQEFVVPDTNQANNTYLDSDGVRKAKFGNICWFTNLDLQKRHEELVLYKHYSPEEYPKYDNYDAIEVSKVSDIPCDYLPSPECGGNMGVPITYLDKHNPDQFEIVRFRKGNDGKDLTYTVPGEAILDRQTSHALLQDRRSPQDVTESWASQSPSSTNTAPSSSRSSEQQKAREKDSQTVYGMKEAELLKQQSRADGNISDSLSAEKCNGIMGVPITFLDKYNPHQFEIIGLLQSSDEKLAGVPILRTYNDFKEMRQDMTFTGCSGGKANGNPVLAGKSAKGNFLYNPQTGEYVHSAYARILIRRKQV